jgi:hypothetical protein
MDLHRYVCILIHTHLYMYVHLFMYTFIYDYGSYLNAHIIIHEYLYIRIPL